jgi:hypothetical protein
VCLRFRKPLQIVDRIVSASKLNQANRSVSLGSKPCLSIQLGFAKTLADFEINDIAALPPRFCYNSYPCFALSASCASKRWFASCARVGVSYWRISHYVNSSPY